MTVEFVRRLSVQKEGHLAPWVIIDGVSGRAVGITTHCNRDPANRRVEIGSTWLSSASQRTGGNTSPPDLSIR